MKKTFRRWYVAILAVLCAVCFTWTAAIAGRIDPVSAEENGNVLYDENFSNGIPNELSSYLVAEDGAALVSSGGEFTLPIAAMAQSNNYEVSFDLKLKSEAEFRMVFKGLSGKEDGANNNIFLAERGNGAYWLFNDDTFKKEDGSIDDVYPIYNNSGDMHGGLDYTPVDLSEFASVKVVHYEGYLELWVNGTRRIVTHLSNFGNTNYHTRTELKEGTVTGIALQAFAANVAVIDNLKVKEAVGLETSYRETNAGASSSKIFPLSAQNLYRDNFKVTGTFRIDDATKSGYYPTIKLAGLNASLTSRSGREYCVNVQAFADGTSFTPQVFWQSETQEWNNAVTDDAVVTVNGTIEYRIEVYGDHFDVYFNGKAVMQTTFTQMGMTKGHLQYVWIKSGDGGASWTGFSYDGYENQTAAEVSVSGTRLISGETLTATADLFGAKEETFAWYVNGTVQSESGTTLTLENMTPGTYRISYESASYQSNEAVVEVSDQRITIACENDTIYTTEETTVSAVLDGDFSDGAPVWYVNHEAQATTGNTLTLSGLDAGIYTIVCKTDTVASNEITVTVLEGEIVVTTEKNSYFDNETALFEAELLGFDESAEITWLVDDEVVEGQTGLQLSLDLAGTEIGAQKTVVCRVQGIDSEPVVITVVYDVLNAIKQDENYKTISEAEIDPSKEYGNFSVGSDNDGNYLYTEQTSDGTWWNYGGLSLAGTSFIMEYKLYIPADISGKYYVYPCLFGLNSKYSGSAIETAIEVNAEGVSPYIKDQGTGKTYGIDAYGFGKDLDYGALVQKGAWTQVAVAVQGQYITMYLNGEIVLFFRLTTATVPSGASFNLYPDGGSGVVPVRLKDIAFGQIKEPAPDLVSVTLSVSSVNAEVGKSVTVTANLNPFNAEVESVEWYVNDAKVDGTGLSIVYTPETAGEYTFRCVVNGIESSSKTVTVTAGGQAGGETDGGLQPWAVALIVVACVVVVGGAAAAVVIVRKKKN